MLDTEDSFEITENQKCSENIDESTFLLQYEFLFNPDNLSEYVSEVVDTLLVLLLRNY